VGAIHDSVMLIAVHDVGHTHLARTLSNLAFQSYRVLKIFPGQLYSWSRFLEHVGPRDFLRHLEHGSTFQRGLPSDSELRDLETADIFSSVLRDGSVTEATSISKDFVFVPLTDGCTLTRVKEKLPIFSPHHYTSGILNGSYSTRSPVFQLKWTISWYS